MIRGVNDIMENGHCPCAIRHDTTRSSFILLRLCFGMRRSIDSRIPTENKDDTQVSVGAQVVISIIFITVSGVRGFMQKPSSLDDNAGQAKKKLGGIKQEI
ncbi:uncharacterized protein MCYG_00294 [Microsporum canis CBS 113480]|uniref:Uncharacterized protein n=1 Tax=Arthroderma otae (strain ATCC MYA-4605 / CBS 113480) TaxID=554155 RepID=C5FCG2_ARTOC|nr:uncharacterized protein MCYG_00294 [Microsporum canis CBS 113480]EEQ27406.1 predicted protein [Microsporum canis CBS 113480]